VSSQLNKEEEMLNLLGVLALMLFILALVKVIVDHRLRNKILSREIPQDMAGRLLQPESARSRALGSLKWALVLIGIGIGIVAGQLAPPEMREEITLAGIFVFAGMGYFVYFLVALRWAKGE
jgi:hypothetical protein